jgi:hypothetical protein
VDGSYNLLESWLVTLLDRSALEEYALHEWKAIVGPHAELDTHLSERAALPSSALEARQNFDLALVQPETAHAAILTANDDVRSS